MYRAYRCADFRPLSPPPRLLGSSSCWEPAPDACSSSPAGTSSSWNRIPRRLCAPASEERESSAAPTAGSMPSSPPMAPISRGSTRHASFSSRRMDLYTRGVRGGMELRVALTVPDFDRAVAFYRDTLGLEQLADWSGEDGRVILLAAGSAALELFDEQQAESVDRIEAGRRVSG